MTPASPQQRRRGRAWKPDATGKRCVRCARTWNGHAGRSCYPVPNPAIDAFDPPRPELLKLGDDTDPSRRSCRAVPEIPSTNGTHRSPTHGTAQPPADGTPPSLSRPRRRLQRPKPARARADARPRRTARRAMTRTEYQSIGDLSDAERAWDRRLAAAGHCALGWRILGRNGDGDLVAATTLPGPGASLERYCTATLTPGGLVYATLTRPRTPPQSPPEAPTAP